MVERSLSMREVPGSIPGSSMSFFHQHQIENQPLFHNSPAIGQLSGWPSGLRRCVQVAVHFCGRGFESHFWQNLFISATKMNKQSGAVEACWAHNPEVRRSKLRSAKFFQQWPMVPLAQRIARWTSNPKVLGSIPRWDECFFLPQNVNVRMAEWSKAPDSRHCLGSLIGICENSGPRMRAWVQIPLLTNQFFLEIYFYCNILFYSVFQGSTLGIANTKQTRKLAVSYILL